MSRQCSPAELRAHPRQKIRVQPRLRQAWRRDSARRGGFYMGHGRASRRLDRSASPIVVLRPARQTIPVVFASPHSGRGLSRRTAGRDAARWPQPAPQRGQLRRRTVRRGAGTRCPAARSHLPARLVRRQPRAVGTRSGDVRRPAAVLGQHHQRAGRRRTGHDRAGRRVRRGDLSRQAVVRRRRDGGSAPAGSRSTMRWRADRRDARRVRPLSADRLPFDADAWPRDAVGARPADFVLGDAHGTACAPRITRLVETCWRSWATACGATTRMPAATSPATTAGRARASMRCRSRSPANSTWTRAGSSGCRVSPRCAKASPA